MVRLSFLIGLVVTTFHLALCRPAGFNVGSVGDELSGVVGFVNRNANDMYAAALQHHGGSFPLLPESASHNEIPTPHYGQDGGSDSLYDIIPPFSQGSTSHYGQGSSSNGLQDNIQPYPQVPRPHYEQGGGSSYPYNNIDLSATLQHGSSDSYGYHSGFFQQHVVQAPPPYSGQADGSGHPGGTFQPSTDAFTAQQDVDANQQPVWRDVPLDVDTLATSMSDWGFPADNKMRISQLWFSPNNPRRRNEFIKSVWDILQKIASENGEDWSIMWVRPDSITVDGHASLWRYARIVYRNRNKAVETKMYRVENDWAISAHTSDKVPGTVFLVAVDLRVDKPKEGEKTLNGALYPIGFVKFLRGDEPDDHHNAKSFATYIRNRNLRRSP